MTITVYNCHHCPAAFDIKVSLVEHVKNHHSTVISEIEDAKPNIKFEISTLPKVDKTMDDLKDMNAAMMNYRKQLEQPAQQLFQGKPVEERKHKCHLCSKSFDHKSNLRRHAATSHSVSKKYKCKMCYKVYRYKWNFKAHIREHKGPKIYFCFHCDKRSSTKLNLAKHISIVHNGDSKKCRICFDKFEDKDDLFNHMKEHKNRRFKCCSCDRIFTSETRMRSHIDMKHSEELSKLHKCGKCMKVFADETLFYYHSKKHDKYYRCSECEKRFVTEEIVTQHFRNVHEQDDVYICNYCYDSFKNKPTIIDHFNDHGNPFMCNHCYLMFNDADGLRNHDCSCCFTCPFCSRKYKIEKHLEKHIESCIQITSNSNILKALEKCRYCQRMFRNEDKLKLHEALHTKEKTLYKCLFCYKVFKKLISFEKHMAIHETMNIFKCHLCSKGYPTEKNLQRHLLSHHLNKSYKCKTCCKKFESEEALLEHAIVHERRIHKCPQCTETFKNKKHLKQHLLAHEKIKVFHCPKCPKLFRHESHLTNHIIVHDESEVHKCLYCYRVFVHKAHLDKHLILHETNDLHNCDYCVLSFPNDTDLMRHMRTHEEYYTKNKCNMCHELFQNEIKLKSHMKNIHNIHICSHCGEECPSFREYSTHLLIVHNVESSNNEKDLSSMHKCDECQKKFSTEIHLRNHKKYIHDQVHLIKTHSCHLCAKTFAFQSQLSLHVQFHQCESESNQSFNYENSNQSSFVYNDETSGYSHIKQGPEDGGEDSTDTYMDDTTQSSNMFLKHETDDTFEENVEFGTKNSAIPETYIKDEVDSDEPMLNNVNSQPNMCATIIPIDYGKEVSSVEPVHISNSMLPINYIKEENGSMNESSHTIHPIAFSTKEELNDSSYGSIGTNLISANNYNNTTLFNEHSDYMDEDEELQEEDITNHLHEIQDDENTHSHLMEIKQYHLQLHNDNINTTFENDVVKKDMIEDVDEIVYTNKEVVEENQENILNHIHVIKKEECSTEQTANHVDNDDLTVKEEVHECSECNTTYCKLKDLVVHVNKVHNHENQISELSAVEI